MTGASREAPKVKVLDRVFCICYPIQSRKDKGKDVLTLLDSRSEINAITLVYATHLGLKVRVTNVGVQKINKSSPATYSMVIAAFQVIDKLDRFRFFQETFLLANSSIKELLGMPFLNLSNVDVQFAKKKLTWRIYTTKKTLPTIRQVEIIDWKKFAQAALDENVETFMIHVNFLGLKISIQLMKEAQLALLLTEKVTMPVKYLDFADAFLEKSANVFSERTGANEHAIELEKGKQAPYGPIYSLEPVEFKILKTYIETNLANVFIQTLKSPAGAPILFVRKPNGSFCLCINYWGLNNLTIRNWYLLPLMNKSLDWLGRA